MKYRVSMAVNGRIDVDVDADNFEEAKEKAKIEATFVDMSNMEVVGMTAVNAEDEYGEERDY